ncbi:hypothetical protein PTKIN_Ptkin03bG0208200 [Pterospermum kingtungense]
MKPVYLNPSPSSFPLAELKEEPHVQLSLSPVQQTASSLSADDHPTFFNTTFTTQDQRVGAKPEESKPHDHKARTLLLCFFLFVILNLLVSLNPFSFPSSSIKNCPRFLARKQAHHLHFNLRWIFIAQPMTITYLLVEKWMRKKLQVMLKDHHSNGCSLR